MRFTSPLTMHIAYEIEYFDDQDLIEWALAYLSTDERFVDDFDFIELISINTKNIREVEKAGRYLFGLISRQWPGFNLKGNKAEFYAK